MHYAWWAGHDADMRANLVYELYQCAQAKKFTCKKGELLLEL